jgi:hypothetical protein
MFDPWHARFIHHAHREVWERMHRLRTSSMSTMVSLPTPLLTIASAVQDPTPPTPKMHTCALWSRAREPSPWSFSTPPKRSDLSSSCEGREHCCSGGSSRPRAFFARRGPAVRCAGDPCESKMHGGEEGTVGGCAKQDMCRADCREEGDLSFAPATPRIMSRLSTAARNRHITPRSVTDRRWRTSCGCTRVTAPGIRTTDNKEGHQVCKKPTLRQVACATHARLNRDHNRIID